MGLSLNRRVLILFETPEIKAVLCLFTDNLAYHTRDKRKGWAIRLRPKRVVTYSDPDSLDYHHDTLKII